MQLRMRRGKIVDASKECRWLVTLFRSPRFRQSELNLAQKKRFSHMLKGASTIFSLCIPPKGTP